MHLYFTCFTSREFKFELMIVWTFKTGKACYTFSPPHFYRLKLFLLTLISVFCQMRIALIGVVFIFSGQLVKDWLNYLYICLNERIMLYPDLQIILITHILRLIYW